MKITNEIYKEWRERYNYVILTAEQDKIEKERFEELLKNIKYKITECSNIIDKPLPKQPMNDSLGSNDFECEQWHALKSNKEKAKNDLQFYVRLLEQPYFAKMVTISTALSCETANISYISRHIRKKDEAQRDKVFNIGGLSLISVYSPIGDAERAQEYSSEGIEYFHNEQLEKFYVLAKYKYTIENNKLVKVSKSY
jgi:hypothetical protein